MKRGGKALGEVILGLLQEQRHRLLAALENLERDEELEAVFRETLATVNKCEAEVLERIQADVR